MLDLATILIFERERRGLSLRAAAKAIGISNPYLSQLETGKLRNPTLDVIQRLTRLYRIKPAIWIQVKTESDNGARKRPAPQHDGEHK